MNAKAPFLALLCLWARSLLAGVTVCAAAVVLGGCPPAWEQKPARKETPYVGRVQPSQQSDFLWPGGRRAAISLTFDDARASQVDNGLPILDAYGIKATFYIAPRNAMQRLDGWKKAAANGHEIGNHTMSHPCTGNFRWSRKAALEDYTLEAMAYELDEANAAIEHLLKKKPRTFAYPCGQKFVGRGTQVRSYVPLVAEQFIVGRGAFDEVGNDPAFCDLAQVAGMELDGLAFEQVKALVDQAAQEGRWLVFFGHEIGDPGRQTSSVFALDALCQYATRPGSELWIDTVETIGKYVLEQRAPPGN